MAYEKQTWNCDDVITADKLNHMEDGIANCGGGTASEPLILTMTGRQATSEECADGGTVIEYSHSWQEVYDALGQGRPAYCKTPASTASVETLCPIVLASFQPKGGYTCTYLDVDSRGGINASVVFFTDATSKVYISCDGGEA